MVTRNSDAQVWQAGITWNQKQGNLFLKAKYNLGHEWASTHLEWGTAENGRWCCEGA